MRIALFTIDTLASDRGVRALIDARRHQIVLVGLSAPRSRGLIREGWHYLSRCGARFTAFLFINDVLPRWAGASAALFHRLGLSPRPTLVDRCAALGIPTTALVDVNGPDVLALLLEHQVDLVVSCYFDQIFDAETIRSVPLGIVNLHPSLLPRHRGPVPVLYGRMDRPTSLGVTIHAVDERIDTGPILAQEAYTPQEGETVLRSMMELVDRGVRLLGGVLDSMERGEVVGRAQHGGSYEGYPPRRVMKMFTRSGGRMADLSDIIAALATPVRIPLATGSEPP